MSRYQGLVALDGGRLEDAAHEYSSAPSRSRPACASPSARSFAPATAATSLACRRHPAAISANPPERARMPNWIRGTRRKARSDAYRYRGRRLGGGPVADRHGRGRRIDRPEVSSERLLYRLFHERGVRVFTAQPVRAKCSCSRDAVAAMLNSFAAKDRAEMVKDDKVVVTCEFCSSVYEFTCMEAGVEE